MFYDMFKSEHVYGQRGATEHGPQSDRAKATEQPSGGRKASEQSLYYFSTEPFKQEKHVWAATFKTAFKKKKEKVTIIGFFSFFSHCMGVYL